MDPCDSASDARAFEGRPCGLDAVSGGAARERARAESLTQARAALASAVLADSRGQAACLRILEPFVHGGRWRRTALLLERPVPAWVEPHILALHTQAGCQRRALGPIPMDPQDLTEILGQLPWSGEWLIAVGDRLSDGALTDDVRALAARWVAERNAFIEAHVGLVRHVVNRHAWSAGVSREDLIQEGLLALCRAVERFDPDRGARFSSYAVPVIRHAIAQPVRRMGPVAGNPGPGPINHRRRVPGAECAEQRRRQAPAPGGPVPGCAPRQRRDPGRSAGRPGEPSAGPRRPGRPRARTATRGPEHAAGRGRRDRHPAAGGCGGEVGRPVHAIARRVGRTPAEVRTLIRDALGLLRAHVTAANGDGAAGVHAVPRLLAGRWWCASPNGSPRPLPRRTPGGRALPITGDARRMFAPIPLEEVVAIPDGVIDRTAPAGAVSTPRTTGKPGCRHPAGECSSEALPCSVWALGLPADAVGPVEWWPPKRLRPYAPRHVTVPMFRGSPSWAILQHLVKESGVREPLLPSYATGRSLTGRIGYELAKALGLTEVPVPRAERIRSRSVTRTESSSTRRSHRPCRRPPPHRTLARAGAVVRAHPGGTGGRRAQPGRRQPPARPGDGPRTSGTDAAGAGGVNGRERTHRPAPGACQPRRAGGPPARGRVGRGQCQGG